MGVDKTPSFMVSPEKGIWHDFSANKGVISLLLLWKWRGFLSVRLWKSWQCRLGWNCRNMVVEIKSYRAKTSHEKKFWNLLVDIISFV